MINYSDRQFVYSALKKEDDEEIQRMYCRIYLLSSDLEWVNCPVNSTKNTGNIQDIGNDRHYLGLNWKNKEMRVRTSINVEKKK